MGAAFPLSQARDGPLSMEGVGCFVKRRAAAATGWLTSLAYPTLPGIANVKWVVAGPVKSLDGDWPL